MEDLEKTDVIVIILFYMIYFLFFIGNIGVFLQQNYLQAIESENYSIALKGLSMITLSLLFSVYATISYIRKNKAKHENR